MSKLPAASEWITEEGAARRIVDDGDVRDVIELLRLNYDRAVAR